MEMSCVFTFALSTQCGGNNRDLPYIGINRQCNENITDCGGRWFFINEKKNIADLCLDRQSSVSVLRSYNYVPNVTGTPALLMN